MNESKIIKVIVYADSQTVFVIDWLNLLSANKKLSFMLVCSTTNKVFSPYAFPIKDIKENPTIRDRYSLLIFVKKFRKLILSRYKSNWFEEILNIYRILTIGKYAKFLQQQIDIFQPDIVHAMRIPYEGIIATYYDIDKPVVLSIWGNDLTLHAANKGSKKTKLIVNAIKKASAMHVDAHRDIETLWGEYKFNQSKPYLLSPASGGVNLNNLRLDISKKQAKIKLGFDANTILVCNPRGLRSYIDTNLYIVACEAIQDKVDNTTFLLVGVDDSFENWSFSEDSSNNKSSLVATGSLPIDRFRLLLRAIDVLVSPSYHDGMPISLLEGMGSGVYPVLSNIESVAGFVRHDQQGRLFDLGNPQVLSDVLFDVITNVDFSTAANDNERLAFEEYSVESCKPKIEDFYQDVYNQTHDK